jgi:hypothetical protein
MLLCLTWNEKFESKNHSKSKAIAGDPLQAWRLSIDHQGNVQILHRRKDSPQKKNGLYACFFYKPLCQFLLQGALDV